MTSVIFDFTNWLYDDGPEKEVDLTSFSGLIKTPTPDNFEKWSKVEKTKCPSVLTLQDNRFRIALHCLDLQWNKEATFDPNRIDPVQQTCLIDESDRLAIDKIVAFLSKDKPSEIDWKLMHSFTDLITECSFETKTNIVCVPWESSFGKIMRKNKIAFKIFQFPKDQMIRVDKPTVSLIMRGIAEQNLNAKLTNELRVIDLIAGNMQCYVCKATNKRLKGLAKQLKQKCFPKYTPPKGLGKRIGPHGLAAGKAVDEAIGTMITGGDMTEHPKWSRVLAARVYKILKLAGIQNLQSQVVVWSEKRQVATAVDVSGYCTKTSSQALIEIKYSSHSLKTTKYIYKLPDPVNKRFRGCNLLNSLYNQHQMQIRETARLYKSNYKGKKVSAGVLVICADGGVMFNCLKS